MSDIEYVLPKTYNGKTVTDLFPEFKHNSVLRFSKLFGPGRVTSLPKLWKGAKKRKKLNDSKIDTRNDENQENQLNIIDSKKQDDKSNQEYRDNDILFDETSQISIDRKFKELIIDYGRQALNDEVTIDDEIKLLQPYQIDDESIKSNNQQIQQHKDLKNKNSNWKYGPASYWYNQAGANNLDNYEFEYGFKKKKSNENLNSSKAITNTSSNNVSLNEENLLDSDIQDTFSLNIAVNELNIPNESYLLVNTINWEDKIIYDNTTRDKIDLSNERIKFAGWIPSAEHRSLSSFQSKVLGKNSDYLSKKEEEPSLLETTKPTVKWSSIFPNENYELMYGDWEKNIIFDPQNMETIPSPPEFILDANDDNLMFSIPEEPTEVEDVKIKETQNEVNAKKKKNELYEHRAKISKSLLGRNGILKDDVHDDKDEQQRESKDFWNLSNDDYYSQKINTENTTAKSGATLVLQHSIVATELRPPFFPTHISITKLRNFHRLPLKRYLNGPLSENKPHRVGFFGKEVKQSEKAASSGSGEGMVIRNASDLTGMDGNLVLAEYSEQYPPLMMQIGMATKIKNYYKRKLGKDDGPPQIEYGENSVTHASPFLGGLKPGDFLQSFENYLFRSPIYLHSMPSTDFLIIRVKQGYFIREIKDIFVVGQECPLIEVPGPNSKRANLFMKEFLQAHIYRLFHRSKDKPKRIKMEDIRKAFPTHAESSIRKRLKLCADFKRTGLTKFCDANWWVLKDNVRLPTEEEIRSSVTPEQCCAYYSMLAAEQRLKDAGYGEKNLFAADDEDVDNIKIDDEVKNAPWHTTRAYLDATKGKCLLQINGVADPTGRGEGFSYVRQPIKPNKQEEEQQQEQQKQQKEQDKSKRMVTGTDADLRRLHLKDAKKLLLKYGLPQEEIDKLKRWEIIDVVRTMSTQKAKEGSESAVSKFARGNRLTQSDAHEKFREECQRLFELQNRSLASHEILSTDDDEDSNEDTDVDEMGKNLESMLQSKRTGEANNETSNEKELKQLIMPNRILSATNYSNSNEKGNGENSQDCKDSLFKSSKLISNQDLNNQKQNRILKITRTYKNEDTGQEYTQVETIKKALIIDAYIRIRTTKDDDYIRQAFALDEEEREQLRKERRRLQEQLRRVKRNEAARRNNESKDDGDSETQNESEIVPIKPPKKKYKKEQTLQTSLDESGLNISISSQNKEAGNVTQPTKTVRCGACGAIGHSRSNRECPLFTPKEVNVSHDDTNDNENSQTSGFTKVQGTKLIIDKRAITKTSKEPKVPRKYNKQNKLLLQQQQQQLNQQQQEPQQSEQTEQIQDQSANTSKIDDGSSSSSSTPLKMKLTLTIPKEKLTNPKIVKPLKIQKIHSQFNKQSLKLQIPKKVLQNKQQMSNPMTPNTINQDNNQIFFPNHHQQQQQQNPLLSFPSQQSFQQQISKDSINKKPRKNLSQMHCDYLDKPQKKVDRRHTDPLVSFASIIENILNEIRDLPDSQPFLLPVNGKKVIDYYNLIKNPIDLQTIRDNVRKNYTKINNHFLDDIKLIVSNSELYNGSNHMITGQARNVYEYCLRKINERKDKLIRLEKAINPLLDDNSLIKFNYLLEKIFNEQIMSIENSYAFHKPVNKAKYKDYYDIIKNPIDLETIKNRIMNKKYKSREQFLSDFNLLYNNCFTYNGINHSYTKTADKILNTCKIAIESDDQLASLEEAIEASFLIGDAIRGSIEMTDSESNLATFSSFHENESNDAPMSTLTGASKTNVNVGFAASSTSIKYHEEHVFTNISMKTKNSMSNSSVWQEKLQLNMSPQSIPTSDQDVYVDVESIDDKGALMDDLQISEDDEDD